jgi:hypothetical protein
LAKNPVGEKGPRGSTSGVLSKTYVEYERRKASQSAPVLLSLASFLPAEVEMMHACSVACA